MVRRLLVPSAALLWGLQFALLNPALALLLVALYDADAAQVGLVLALYNGAGFLASLLVPGYADRRGDYLQPMLVCGALTIALAVVLTVSTTLPVAVVALIVLGGPAGVGNSLLFAHLRHSGASASDVIHTRAYASFAWIAGPPLATLVMATFGNRAVLPLLGAVAVLTTLTAAALVRDRRTRTRARTKEDNRADTGKEEHPRMPRTAVTGIVIAFVLLQATNAAVVSIMSLFTTSDLGLDVVWAGVALGVAAGLEIPALLLVGRLARRFSHLQLLVSGCAAGIVYYVAMTQVENVVTLVAVQVINAWFFAVIAGVGLTLFQEVIPRPGLASGLYANTRRVGAVVSGPLIVLGAGGAGGYGTVFAACAVLTAVALGGVLAIQRGAARRRRTPTPSVTPS